MAEVLREALGQPVLVENRTGAGGQVGLEATLRAPKDGDTLSMSAIPPCSSIRCCSAQQMGGNIVYVPYRGLAPATLDILSGAPVS